MDPRQLFSDDRNLGMCVLCGGAPDTRDHVPAKIFLDDPLPDQLPVVDACLACNNTISGDEEYLACMLEAIITGSTANSKREKVKRSLAHSPGLASRIEASSEMGANGEMRWNPEVDRVDRVVVKLARGHTAYELSLPQFQKPASVQCRPLLTMSEEERHLFEDTGAGEAAVVPEIGSRAFLRVVVASPNTYAEGPWIEVQRGRYRYSVVQDTGVMVRIVISEYLACEVAWD